ncbi:cytochrome c3 family protein [Cupriavidus sp. SIMBA_020]|uniref:cytochrome c3 family protein n=1 Tax=Cupriavidus sp. SIMBA_020 TaxID=3085766 RepID=UPI0039787547
MLDLLKRYWRTINRPSAYFSLGFLTLGGFIAGVVFWGAFNTALEFTNTEKFCTGCHEMRDNVYQELQGTIHFTNRSGVRAKCSDCHVPHNWTDKMARKMQASKEVWAKIFGTIDTREKFQAHRLELAQHEWARFKANDSLECRNCHDYQSMDFTRQSPRAQTMHSTYLANKERTCIDCHKGIAHRLPDVSKAEGSE